MARTERQVAVKCIERSKYEQHVARHRGQLNEDPIKEVAVWIAGRGGCPYVLPLLATYADEQTVYVTYRSALTGIYSGLWRGWRPPGSDGRDVHGANC